MKTLPILAATALASMAVPAIAAPAAPVAERQQVIQPGTVVWASDGSELGRLEGSRTSVDGEAQVVIRDTDGNRRAIPTTAVMLHGESLRATWSPSQFRSAPVLVPANAADAAGTGGIQGGRGDPSELRNAINEPGPETPVYADPTRRTEVQQQQAPGENPR